MAVKILQSLINIIWQILYIPIIVLFAFIFVFFILVTINLIIGRIKGRKLPVKEKIKVRKRNAFLKIFVDLPKQYAEDMFNREPDWFEYQGIHLFAGEQGNGKTVAMVEFMLRMQKEFPKSKCITNFDYIHQDDELKHWIDLIDYKNGRKGVIVGIDEIQMWFSSNESRDFPPDFLEAICQNRKNRRCIVASSQVFTRVAKPIREQTTLLYLPITFLGCLTVVLIKKPILDEQGNLKQLKHRGSYFFIHNKEIRDAFDTYKAIERLAKSGVKPGEHNSD